MKFAINHRYTRIHGWISPVDYDHVDRLRHFYEKHFCVVETNDEERSGNFELDLTEPELMLLKAENLALKERNAFLEESAERYKRGYKSKGAELKTLELQIQDDRIARWRIKVIRNRHSKVVERAKATLDMLKEERASEKDKGKQ